MVDEEVDCKESEGKGKHYQQYRKDSHEVIELISDQNLYLVDDARKEIERQSHQE